MRSAITGGLFYGRFVRKLQKAQPGPVTIHMKVFYYVGRFLQLVGLVVLPSAIWAGSFYHNERAAITIFVGSIFIFFIGWLFVR